MDRQSRSTPSIVRSGEWRTMAPGIRKMTPPTRTPLIADMTSTTCLNRRRMKYADLNDEQQKQVRDALRDSPESKRLSDAKSRLRHTQQQFLDALTGEPLTTGALFAAVAVAIEFANDAIESMSDVIGHGAAPVGWDHDGIIRSLLINYVDDLVFNADVTEFFDASKSFDAALDAKAMELFGKWRGDN